MPKVSAEYREARREEITAAALRCFAAKGFKETSMTDIIAESGLSAGAIYGHFQSKHEIMMSAAGQVIDARVGDLDELAAGGAIPSPGEVVTRMLIGIAGQVAEPSLLVQVWGQAMIEDGVRDLLVAVFARIQQGYQRYFTAWAMQHSGLDEPAAGAWAADLVPIAVGLAQGFIVQSALFDEFDPDGYAASVRRLLPHDPASSTPAGR